MSALCQTVHITAVENSASPLTLIACRWEAKSLYIKGSDANVFTVASGVVKHKLINRKSEESQQVQQVQSEIDDPGAVEMWRRVIRAAPSSEMVAEEVTNVVPSNPSMLCTTIQTPEFETGGDVFSELLFRHNIVIFVCIVIGHEYFQSWVVAGCGADVLLLV